MSDLRDMLELPFTLVGASPETLPAAKMARYVLDLAELMGSADQVHFKEIREGSAVIALAIEQEARPLVLPRIRSAARGAVDAEGGRAWTKINVRLSEDGFTARMALPGGEVIQFPGAPKADRPIGPIKQLTSLQGRLVRIEGGGDPVMIGLDEDTGLASKITIPASRAQELAGYFHQHVRLTGMGRWRRTAEGEWQLSQLDADSFEVLDDTPFGDVIRRVRDLIPRGEGAAALRWLKDND